MGRFNALLFLMLIFTAACRPAQPAATPPHPALAVEDAWARPSPQGAPAAAFYMTIANHSPQQDALLQVSSDHCEAVEIHLSEIDEAGVMRMAPVEDGRLPIPAGETVLLEPGGLHIMCVGLTRPLLEGEQAALLLEFEAAGPMDVMASIHQGDPEAADHDHEHNH